MFHSHSSFGLPTQQNVAVVHTKSTFEKYWPSCLASKCLSIWRKLHRRHQWFCACVLLHIHCRFKLVTMPPLWHHKCSHHMNLQYCPTVVPEPRPPNFSCTYMAMPNPSAKGIGMFRYFGVSGISQHMSNIQGNSTGAWSAAALSLRHTVCQPQSKELSFNSSTSVPSDLWESIYASVRYIDLYLGLPRGAEWMMFGVPIYHPLGFKQQFLGRCWYRFEMYTGNYSLPLPVYFEIDLHSYIYMCMVFHMASKF